MDSTLRDIGFKLDRGERLNAGDGIALFECNDLLGIGRLAQSVRTRLHGKRVHYSVNLHLNPTNICVTRCSFCAFSRSSDDPDAYTLSIDEAETRIARAVERWGINEVHMVGGHNPALGLDYYTELFRRVASRFPEVFIKALSAPEVHDLASRSGLSIKETLERLKKSGLGGMPGGGAEILAAEVRKQICPQKISGEEWLKVHETAHGLGIPTNATMLYGHVENYADRVDHMMRIRTLQDETHGFRSFVPFPYCRPGLNAQDRAGNGATSVTMSSGFTDLKVLSIARLLLDNIPHLKVHWPATDFKFALAALSFGADDIGGTNLHERVMREAGSLAPAGLSSGDLVRCIREADYEPFLADSSFELR